MTFPYKFIGPLLENEHGAIVASMRMEEYLDRPELSRSMLDAFHRSPAHYKALLASPRRDTEALIFGRAAHKLMLEEESFDACYASLPCKIDKRTRDGRQAYADFCLDNAGKAILELEDMERLRGMALSLAGHQKAMTALHGGGIIEASMFWDLDGVLCKGRTDVLNIDGKWITDYKTANDARPEAFSKAAWDHRYHVQAAIYTDAAQLLTGVNDLSFVFVAQECVPPYAVAVYIANEAMVDQGRREYLADLELFKACQDNDIWPAYPDEIMSLVLPAWAQREL